MQAKNWSLKQLSGIWQVAIFIICVAVGAVFINTFIFRTFNVSGLSMQNTLQDGDRLVVDRLPVTMAELENKQYVPTRGQIIVFKNPNYSVTPDEYIVKRVIAFAGERVVLKDGKYTVYNAQNPNGFNPDTTDKNQPGSPTVGDVDVTVPDGSLFVSGDHRQINTETGLPYSLDSRNGLGYIPLYDIVGPVSVRILPVTKIQTF